MRYVFLIASVVLALLIPGAGMAQNSLVSQHALTPELALELAQASLANCRSSGYQVAVAVVDRMGGTQVMLRDRYAGPTLPIPLSAKPGPR